MTATTLSERTAVAEVTQYVMSRKTLERIKDALTLGSQVRPNDFNAWLKATDACTVALVALEMLATEVPHG